MNFPYVFIRTIESAFRLANVEPETEVISIAKQKKGELQEEPIRTSRKKQAKCLKRGKIRVTKSPLVFILDLIG